MEKFLLFPVEGDPKVIEIQENDLLQGLQDAVEGYIETVPFTDSHVMIVNEEGRLNGQHFNYMASTLMGLQLFGPCVLAAIVDRDGESDIGGLTPEFARIAIELLNIERKK